MVREDYSEYLKKCEKILSDLSEFTRNVDFNEGLKIATRSLREHETLMDFVLLSYKKYLEISKRSAIEKLNYGGIEHPNVRFPRLRNQVDKVEEARKYIESQKY